MNEKSSPQSPEQTTFILQMLMFSMISSVGVFFFLASQVDGTLPPGETAGELTKLFTIVAFFTATASFIIPQLLTPSSKRDYSGKKTITVQHYFVPTVLSFALSETVAIFGFLACEATKNFNDFLPFGVSALLLMLIHRFRTLARIRKIGL